MADIYDGALRTIIHDCKSFVLPLINEVFGEHYTGDEKIVFHPNEHFLDQQEDPDVKRITDTSFSVITSNPKNYHIECESSKYSGKILLRLFEYDAQIALDEYAEIEESVLTVSFPNTTVIYLRDTSATPDELTVKIVSPSGEITYQIPVVKINNYSIDVIFNKELYILIPFFIFNFEKDFEKYNTDEECLQNLENKYKEILSKLEQLTNKKIITGFDKRTIVELANDVIKELTKKYVKLQKGIGDIMSGALIETEARTILNQGRAEGITQGRAEGLAEVAEEMINDNEPVAKIKKYTSLSIEELQKIAEKIGKKLVM